ncbi:hypothetical protein QBC34DRAFT_386067 [Podospora aff. communis PSN243]|uniref:Uncharacterized protein n=1 Tax=Podospora aff. communis PSN243 TaxID=3040156 RepID=A0AAV9G6K1_9PEZI|nr:hypothetical protein QBC34DRAFT_386067 [Podospora aff. communis PSN243]
MHEDEVLINPKQATPSTYARRTTINWLVQTIVTWYELCDAIEERVVPFSTASLDRVRGEGEEVTIIDMVRERTDMLAQIIAHQQTINENPGNQENGEGSSESSDTLESDVIGPEMEEASLSD